MFLPHPPCPSRLRSRYSKTASTSTRPHWRAPSGPRLLFYQPPETSATTGPETWVTGQVTDQTAFGRPDRAGGPCNAGDFSGYVIRHPPERSRCQRSPAPSQP